MKTPTKAKKRTTHFLSSLRQDFQERANSTGQENLFTLVHMIAYPKDKIPHNFLVAAKTVNRAFDMVQSRWIWDDELVMGVRVLSENCGPQEFIHEIKAEGNQILMV